MSVDAKYRLTIPAKLGYRALGVFPSNPTLIVEVEPLQINCRARSGGERRLPTPALAVGPQ